MEGGTDGAFLLVVGSSGRRGCWCLDDVLRDGGGGRRGGGGGGVTPGDAGGWLYPMFPRAW